MSYSIAWKGMPKERLSCKQLERIFESSPASILVYDADGKIIRMNTAALKLFEIASPANWQGKSVQQFLQEYQPYDEQQQPTIVEPWLMNLVNDGHAVSGVPEQTLILHLPSGQKVYVSYWHVPFFDAEMHALGSFYVFHNITHRYQKALHLQRVHEATLMLTDAVARLPTHIDLTASEETFLISPPVIFVAQQLVHVIHQVLGCRRVTLITSCPEGLVSFIAGSGLTPEQEQSWLSIKGRFLFTELVDESVVARLSAHQEVIVTNEDVRRPLLFRSVFGPEKFLLVPLFLEQQWIGTLIVVKEGVNIEYTSEEIELVKAVAAQTLLIIECLDNLHNEVEAQTRALIQQEINRLSTDFLTIASHELLTPLTVIYGNIQLAQRRLEVLKRLVGDQPERVNEKIEHVQHSLNSASESASLQKRMINDLIDDAQIQTNQLKLHMYHHDLLALLKEAILKQQQAVLGSTIVLKALHAEQRVPILADAERIIRVINTYLANALTHTPNKAPIYVELMVADGEALVSVHNDGPGIPPEEQEHLWERFYRAKGNAVQHELDLSLGLGFYLCRVLIEYHHGHAGVRSDPGQGETFWFTLPVLTSSEQ